MSHYGFHFQNWIDMSKTNIVIAVLGFILFTALIIGFFSDRMNSTDALQILRYEAPIKKMDMTIMTSPNFYGKKQVTISERNLLDSLNTALKYHNKPVQVNIAKDNDVFVRIDLYKSNSKVSLKVVNSKYTGWVLIVGNYNFTNDYVFKFVQKYL
jgi:predicted membrane GTPase involved in stress response